jgi:hypothetical protein
MAGRAVPAAERIELDSALPLIHGGTPLGRMLPKRYLRLPP